MENKLIWVLTLGTADTKYKVVRCKKEVYNQYAEVLKLQNCEIVELDANTYISYDCKLLHDLAKVVRGN